MKKSQPTIKDIAVQLGISFSTVSRALNDNPRIGLKTRELVHAKARELNYVPNPVANILKSNKTFHIGVLVPSLHEEFFIEIIEGIEQIIEAKGYHAIIMQSKEKLSTEKNIVHSFLKMRIDGLLVAISEETEDISHFNELENYGIPVIFFDRVPLDSQAHKVKCDTSTGAEQMLEHLLAQKKENIAFINGPAQLETAKERLLGLENGLARHKKSFSTNAVINSHLDEEAVAEALAVLLKRFTPDAIVCFNDLVAIYSAKALKNTKPQLVPFITFAGFGNLPILKLLPVPPQLSVEQHPRQMGLSAAKLLLECIENEADKMPYQVITLASNMVELY
jgi:DNA-binding LacI/PurR family transcriptional regulator